MSPRLLALAVAGAVLSCTPAARAPLESKLTTYLSDEQVACLIANHVDGVGVTHVDIAAGCAVGADLMGFAITLMQMADAMKIGAKTDGGAP